ncbi:MAG: GTP-binding protein [Anaerolineae bacterium]|nr:GTP-binding protein [Anaerolineae bacterium]
MVDTRSTLENDKGDAENLIYRIVVVGDPQVGKTSLIRRACQNRFEAEAIGTSLHKDNVLVGLVAEVPVTLDIFESTDYRRTPPQILFADTLAVVMVYDVTSPVSFFGLYRWKQEVQRIRSNMPLVVVGNKNDLPSIVPMSEAQGWATFEGIRFMSVSAATGEGVAEIFRQAGQLAHEHHDLLNHQWSLSR